MTLEQKFVGIILIHPYSVARWSPKITRSIVQMSEIYSKLFSSFYSSASCLPQKATTLIFT